MDGHLYWVDWRAIAAITIGGAILGVIGLY